MQIAPVIPVLVIEEVDIAVDLAQALAKGGLRALEITLRTDAAFDAIDAIKSNVNDVYVGVGTVNTPEQVKQCKAHNVDFMVSPGLHEPLLEAARKSGIPYLPGISTASDALVAINAGLDSLKFFPAIPSGGVPMIKALHGPYANVQFCPTGGVGASNAQEFLSLGNVTCVGGSWVAPSSLINSKDWNAITRLAKSANELKS